MEPITALILIGVLCAVGVGGAAVAIRRNHQRSNEIVPGVATSAPQSWAGAHTPEARLHRRLRDAVAAVRGLPASLGVDQGVADAVGEEALAVDEQLVAVARLPQGESRDHAIGEVEAAVAALERAVAGLLTGEGTPGSAVRDGVARHIEEARERRQALLAAWREVEQIDRTQHTDPPMPEPRAEPGEGSAS